jgi:hypothetical protein
MASTQLDREGVGDGMGMTTKSDRQQTQQRRPRNRIPSIVAPLLLRGCCRLVPLNASQTRRRLLVAGRQ